MSIQNKIAIIFTILTAAIISLLSITIYIFVARYTHESFFHRLEVRGLIVGSAYLEDDQDNISLYYEVKEKHLKNLPDEDHYFVHLNSPEELTRDKMPELDLPETFYSDIIEKGSARFLSDTTFYVGQYISRGPSQGIVISSANDVYGNLYLRHLRKIKIIGFLCCLIIVFTAGKLFSYNVFKPVRKIIKEVKGTHVHNLSKPLEQHNGKDEIADLTSTFNDMMNRLHITFEMQNNFISNASHELKTPLTIIAGEAELGTKLTSAGPEAKEAFNTILKEAERLEHLVISMLSLAQTGFDGTIQEKGLLRIDELLIDVKKTMNNINEDNKICFDFEKLPEDQDQLIVSGNEALLKVAVSNVISNACKYSGNQKVTVRISCSRMIRIDVIDTGIGIPEKDLPQVFIPFFRGSNTSSYKGYGIGLPLANNIFKMHKGHINIISKENRETLVSLYLPQAL